MSATFKAKMALALLFVASLGIVCARRGPWMMVRELSGATEFLSPFQDFVADRIVCTNGRAYDLRTGEMIFYLAPPKRHDFGRWATSAISPDGRFIATGPEIGYLDAGHPDSCAIQVWDARTGHHLFGLSHYDTTEEADRHRAPIAYFSPDSSRLVTAWDRTHVWRLDDGARLFSMDGMGFFSLDSQYVASATEAGSLRILDGWTGDIVKELDMGGAASPIQLSGGAAKALTFQHGSTVQVWDVGAAKPVALLPAKGGLDGFAMFSPDGTRILRLTVRTIFYADGLVETRWQDTEVWDSEGYELLTRFPGCGLGQLTGDGTRMVGLTTARAVGIWDVGDGRRLAELPLDTAVTAHPVRGDDDALLVYCYGGIVGGVWLGDEMGVEDTALRVQYWRRRRPEWWWGHLYRPELWVALLSGGALLALTLTSIPPAAGISSLRTSGRRRQSGSRHVGGAQ